MNNMTVALTLNPVTGLTPKYWELEWLSKHEFYLRKGVEGVVESFRRYPVRKYLERFNPHQYGMVFKQSGKPTFYHPRTGKNQWRIKSLDEIVDFSNENFKDPKTFINTEFKVVINNVYYLIFAPRGRWLYPDVMNVKLEEIIKKVN